MTKRIKSRKGQLSIEAGIILLFMILVLISIWIGGPLQQTTEKSTDTNDMILAAQALDAIANAAEIVGMGGIAERRDFVIHMPFNAVDALYGEGTYFEDGEKKVGPHVNITVILYDDMNGMFENYTVDGTGRPFWYNREQDMPPGGYKTPFYYATISKGVPYSIAHNDIYEEQHGTFPLCDDRAKRKAREVRGPETRFVFLAGDDLRDILFCCEAGFNVHIYLKQNRPDPKYEGDLRMKSRHYYSIPGSWILRS